MQCHHFDAGRCRSCTLIRVPHERQISDAEARYRELLAPFAAAGADVWGAPVTSADSRFRATAKMVVTGTAAEPVLGILPEPGTGPGGSGEGPGSDLVDCPLYLPGVEELLEGVRALIRRAQVPPYSVARRRGELKNVLVTTSPAGEHMLRLVLRTGAPLPRIREHLPALLAAQPSLRVVTANLHPEHKAVLTGPEEIHLAGEHALLMRMDGLGPGAEVDLRVRPGSFVQTNTAVAAALYAQVGRWIAQLRPARVWDLYCGVGGFALHCARALEGAAADGRVEIAGVKIPDVEITGVEISREAIASAQETAADSPLTGSRLAFHAADATAWAIEQAERTGPPEAIIVNPPRRGIGERLAAFLEGSGVPHLIYSSCNPATLAADLAAMPSYRITAARLVDMFPHTGHDEMLVRLERAL